MCHGKRSHLHGPLHMHGNVLSIGVRSGQWWQPVPRVDFLILKFSPCFLLLVCLSMLGMCVGFCQVIADILVPQFAHKWGTFPDSPC